MEKKNIPLIKSEIENLPLGFFATGIFSNRRERRMTEGKTQNCRGKISYISIGNGKVTKRVNQVILLKDGSRKRITHYL